MSSCRVNGQRVLYNFVTCFDVPQNATKETLAVLCCLGGKSVSPYDIYRRAVSAGCQTFNRTYILFPFFGQHRSRLGPDSIQRLVQTDWPDPSSRFVKQRHVGGAQLGGHGPHRFGGRKDNNKRLDCFVGKQCDVARMNPTEGSGPPFERPAGFDNTTDGERIKLGNILNYWSEIDLSFSQ